MVMKWDEVDMFKQFKITKVPRNDLESKSINEKLDLLASLYLSGMNSASKSPKMLHSISNWDPMHPSIVRLHLEYCGQVLGTTLYKGCHQDEPSPEEGNKDGEGAGNQVL